MSHMLVIDRRSILLGAAGVLSVGWRAARADQPVGPVMERLSKYMAAAGSTPLPEVALEQAKLHILDTIGAMVSGATLRPGKLAIAFARNYGGEKIATVVASDVVVGPIEAALANGILAHSDETDDSHAPSLSHPGAPIVAATLAAGEKFGVDGARFVRAVALGYDVGTRMNMTLGAEYPAGHRSTHALAGNWGAAAAAGCCAGLNEQQMRWLVDYTAQQSAGIISWQRDRDHIEKAFVFAGMAARNGVNAALLVQSGWTGVDDVLSGADNFFAANGPKVDQNKLVEALGNTVRGRAHQHQEMDGRLADPGLTGCTVEPDAGAQVQGRRCSEDRGESRKDRGVGRQQPRHSGYLPAAHDGGDADRRHGVVRSGA